MSHVVEPTHAAEQRYGWLCPTELDRARFLDMNERVRSARAVQLATGGAATLVTSVWHGWWLALLVVVVLPVPRLLDRVYVRAGRPEVAGALSMAVVELILGTAVLGSGGARSPLLGLLVVPIVMMAARYRVRVVVTGVVLSLVVLAAAVIGAAMLDVPAEAPAVVYVVGYLALAVSVMAASLALLDAELQSRGDAVVDPLTGLFNRKALHGRFEEAAAQARLIDTPVSLVICDLDHFKRVNDEHGHDHGDIVLREAAYRMRSTLRVFDLVYRFGGEEFVVLLPGHDEAAAHQVAERLVAAIGGEQLAGLSVTMSAGVACARGDDVQLSRLVKEADVALYGAKRAGRNCVRAAWPQSAPTV